MSSFISHPYWKNVLAIYPDFSNNSFVKNAASHEIQLQKEFLAVVASGFYPISFTSPLGFKRVSLLTESSDVKTLANNIYEVELGLHPFIKDNWNANVLHCDQFKMTIASLLDDFEIDLPRPEEFELCKKLDIENADMALALAVCDVIEHTAPLIINYVNDFVAQWQCFTGRSSKFLNRTWLDEHNLTEGDTAEDQHIGMIEKMLLPHKEIVESSNYREAKDYYNKLCYNHLDEVYDKLQNVIQRN